MRWLIRSAGFTICRTACRNALMLRHVLQHNVEAARDHYAELAEIVAPDCAGAGQPGANAPLLIDTLDAMIVESGLKPRLRDHGIGADDIADAGPRGDEADPAAGEQSVRDRRSRRARGCTRRRGEPYRSASGRDAYRHFTTITTRWADNDAYGHVNNTVYYQWFDSAVKQWLVERRAARY